MDRRGRYSGALAKYVDDWDTIFEYATGMNSPTPNTASSADTGTSLSGCGQSADYDTSGRVAESRRTQIQVSEQFKQQVYKRFGHRCPLSGIKHSSLLTVSHILAHSDNQELAEDLENVLLLDWTHHMAFDAGLWTFDESGRLWVNPGFQTQSDSLNLSLIERHGEKIDDLAMVADEYIERHNDELDWWPPR